MKLKKGNRSEPGGGPAKKASSLLHYCEETLRHWCVLAEMSNTPRTSYGTYRGTLLFNSSPAGRKDNLFEI